MHKSPLKWLWGGPDSPRGTLTPLKPFGRVRGHGAGPVGGPSATPCPQEGPREQREPRGCEQPPSPAWLRADISSLSLTLFLLSP